jgi:hypothetical protein
MSAELDPGRRGSRGTLSSYRHKRFQWPGHSTIAERFEFLRKKQVVKSCGIGGEAVAALASVAFYSRSHRSCGGCRSRHVEGPIWRTREGE